MSSEETWTTILPKKKKNNTANITNKNQTSNNSESLKKKPKHNDPAKNKQQNKTRKKTLPSTEKKVTILTRPHTQTTPPPPSTKPSQSGPYHKKTNNTITVNSSTQPSNKPKEKLTKPSSSLSENKKKKDKKKKPVSLFQLFEQAQKQQTKKNVEKKSSTPHEKAQVPALSVVEHRGKLRPDGTKKKKISTLKKKIYRDRQRKWLDYNSKLASNCCVLVQNFIEPTALHNEEAYESSLQEIETFYSEFGQIRNVIVHNPDVEPELTDVLATKYPQFSVGAIIIRYDNNKEAEAAAMKTNNSSYKSKIISCDVVTTSSAKDISEMLEKSSKKKFKGYIRIQNFVEIDEVENEDELEDLITEVADIFSVYGDIEDIQVANASNECLGFAIGDVVLKYKSSDVVMDVISKTNNKIFGGKKIDVGLYSGTDTSPETSCNLIPETDLCNCVIVRNFIDKDEIDCDDDEFDDVLSDIRDQFSKYGELSGLVIPRSSKDILDYMELNQSSEDIHIGDIVLEFIRKEDALRAIELTHEKVFGGREISSFMANIPKTFAIGENIKPSQPKSPPKASYEVVPKLPNSLTGIRDYVNQRTDLELCSHVSAFLTRLMSLQERSRFKDPLKAKKTRRLVFGLREVKRGLKAKRIKLLIVANNIDECAIEGGLDDTVKELINLAYTNEVSVVFGLTRRKLGRVLGKTIRVSCVGIYNFDGANEIFTSIKKKLVTLESNLI